MLGRDETQVKMARVFFFFLRGRWTQAYLCGLQQGKCIYSAIHPGAGTLLGKVAVIVFSSVPLVTVVQDCCFKTNIKLREKASCSWRIMIHVYTVLAAAGEATSYCLPCTTGPRGPCGCPKAEPTTTWAAAAVRCNTRFW